VDVHNGTVFVSKGIIQSMMDSAHAAFFVKLERDFENIFARW
jgi:hypothetical protein